MLIGFDSVYTKTSGAATNSVISQKVSVQDNFGVFRLANAGNVVIFRSNGTFGAPINAVSGEILGNFMFEARNCIEEQEQK